MAVIKCDDTNCVNNISGKCFLTEVEMSVSNDSWYVECLDRRRKPKTDTKTNSIGAMMVRRMIEDVEKNSQFTRPHTAHPYD